MKKQIRFLYRYLIVSKRWRRLLNRQMLLVALATLAFLVTLGMTAPTRADREYPQRPKHAADQSRLAAGARTDLTGALNTSDVPQQVTPQPEGAAQVSPTPTITPYPPEFETNADQTIGITLAGALLVLIVVIGTLTILPRKR